MTEKHDQELVTKGAVRELLLHTATWTIPKCDKVEFIPKETILKAIDQLPAEPARQVEFEAKTEQLGLNPHLVIILDSLGFKLGDELKVYAVKKLEEGKGT